MAEEKEACLFVGGPWDGRRVAVDPDAPFIRVHPGEDSSVGVIDAASNSDRPYRLVTYTRATLHAPGRKWVVFQTEDVAEGDVIGRLIAGYGVAIKS